MCLTPSTCGNSTGRLNQTISRIQIPVIFIFDDVSSFKRPFKFMLASQGDAKMPATLTAIGFGSFSDCSALPDVEFPIGLTTIEAYAFSRCSALADLRIPASVATVEAAASEKTKQKPPLRHRLYNRSPFFKMTQHFDLIGNRLVTDW